MSAMKTKKAILAVDDQITSLATVRDSLEGHYDIYMAKNLMTATTILQSTDIDIILLDLEMPECSGITLLTEINKDPRCYHIPVIVVSSHGKADIIIQAKNTGAKDFVVKPFNRKTLLEKIDAVLKASPKKIQKEALFGKLEHLASFCQQGNNAKAEELAAELEHVCCDIILDIDVAAICRYTRDMDYIKAIEKIRMLLGIWV